MGEVLRAALLDPSATCAVSISLSSVYNTVLTLPHLVHTNCITVPPDEKRGCQAFHKLYKSPNGRLSFIWLDAGKAALSLSALLGSQVLEANPATQTESGEGFFFRVLFILHLKIPIESQALIAPHPGFYPPHHTTRYINNHKGQICCLMPSINFFWMFRRFARMILNAAWSWWIDV